MTYSTVQKKKGAYISHVAPGSIAEEVELVPGDRLLKINGKSPRDIIDYRLLASSEEIELEIAKENEEPWYIEIEKEFQEPLGLGFSPATIDPVRTCENNCIFCFIRQNPPGMRETVRFRDDDYRLSFLEGNYITLNNLSEKDIERIVSGRISPLYVSVHTTNPALREKMMCNPRASRIMEKLRALTAGGIHIHGQIVVCPGWNDGKELEKSIEDLASLGPNVESVAVVPVGLTDYRENLTALEPLKSDDAVGIISFIHGFQEEMLSGRDTRFVFLSDEYYIAAKATIPPEETYEDYPQLSNGVGLIRLFMEEYKSWRRLKILPEPSEYLKAAVITGEAAQEYLAPAVEILNKADNLDLTLEIIRSRFFGSNVTVAGLITGLDIIEALRGKDVGQAVFFPGIMLKEGEDLFLDGRSTADVSDALGIKVIPVNGLKELSELISKQTKKGDS